MLGKGSPITPQVSHTPSQERLRPHKKRRYPPRRKAFLR